ncbi:MAG TPA: FAD-dependent oxidoreductase, partial [Gemmatimonadaceae bacterium]|nr:FAD-dependent oxidoreductase [Gemmatimonadaceae bacterium]
MSDHQVQLTGPDLSKGIPANSLADGAAVAGHAFGEAVLLVRAGDEFFAVGATCTHYGAPLGDGIVVGDTVRCPWHHACFSARTGDAVRAPALRPLPRWEVELLGDTVFIRGKIEPQDADLGNIPSAAAVPAHRSNRPDTVLIIGAGAAGSAAAETLRREGFAGAITLVDSDVDAPYDRPNLSKDYLAGTAPEEWLPLRSVDFYRGHGIDLIRGTRASSIDVPAKSVVMADGRTLTWDALLIATGAAPARLPSPIAGAQYVRYLRTLADSRAIIEAAQRAHHAVVLGASFIGLEVAASLRARGVEVHVVAPERVPLERVMGAELGAFIRTVHEEHGVVFHLGHTAAEITGDSVTLENGEWIPADLVVAGIGVRLNTDLAADAGLAVSRGIDVNEYLETSAAGVFAAGDIASWPDARAGDRLRVEHWVVAQRQGQTAARNILGAAEAFDSVPFFWSNHYDVSISYVGHAERWDAIQLSGDLAARDCAAMFRRGDDILAVATVGRDRTSLLAELAMERAAGESL